MAETSIIRRIGGTFAGMTSGAIVIGVLQKLGHQIYPPPSGLDPTDKEAMKAAIATVPVEALVLVLLSYLLGTIVGASTAGWIGRGDRAPVIATTVLLLATGMLNLLMVPHPTWFSALCPVVFILGGVIARRLTRSIGQVNP